MSLPTQRDGAAGPLVVAPENPRYFAVAGTAEPCAVLLTGSHVWNNLHDGLGPDPDVCGEEANSYAAYLDFLIQHDHNFIRLWRWEHFRSSVPGFHLCMAPQPWPRTGPGVAADGKPRFDLSRFEPLYFERLRERVSAAGERGIYVSVMLFEGFCLSHSNPPWSVKGHPFAAGNNVNEIAVASIRDYQVMPLDKRVLTLQRAYIEKTLATVHDLANVLYEVANESVGDPRSEEGDSTEWQYLVVAYVKQVEAERGYVSHPVGMTFQYPDASANANLFDGPADWVSPGFTRAVADDPWYLDPPPNDGRKVVISDTDHYAAGRADPVWAWKTFLRGHHPILMDYGIIDVAEPLPEIPGRLPAYDFFEPTRDAMGATRRLADRLPLGAMEPCGELSSTGYALADPGRAYVVLILDAGRQPLTVELEPGAYACGWSSIDGRDQIAHDRLEVAHPGPVTFAPPMPFGPAVLCLTELFT
jgi:hypothetical protein